MNQKEQQQQIKLSEVLDIRCQKDGKLILLGEVVSMYDWGSDNAPIGEGRFEWDEYSKRFYFVTNGTTYEGSDLSKAIFERI